MTLETTIYLIDSISNEEMELKVKANVQSSTKVNLLFIDALTEEQIEEDYLSSLDDNRIEIQNLKEDFLELAYGYEEYLDEVSEKIDYNKIESLFNETI